MEFSLAINCYKLLGVLGVWKSPIWPGSGLIYARFEGFIYIAENEMRIFYTLRIITHNKIVPNWIEAS